jgi:hypothetical protein
MDTMENLGAERDRVVASVTAIRTGAAGISQLLAGQESSDDWERAVVVLARCREERKRLDDRVLRIDASIARLQAGTQRSPQR